MRIWHRFNRLHLLLFVVSGLAVPAMLLLPLGARWSNVQALEEAVRHAPSWSPAVSLESYRSVRTTEGGPATSVEWLAHAASGWMGYDNLGRSLLFRVMTALFISLSIGLGAGLTAVTLGVVWGAVAALSGRWVDVVMMRLVDLLYGLPYVLMVILLRVGLGASFRSWAGRSEWLAEILMVILAISLVSWLTTARIIRGQVMSLKTRGFVEAAQLASGGRFYILRHHLLPHLWGPALVCTTIVVPQAILQESFLSFLGIGIRQPLPSLGRLTADGVFAVNQYVGFWWQLVFPCGCLILILLGVNAVGERLRRWIDSSTQAGERAGASPAYEREAGVLP
ncbi:MAG: ABC transporter permease [Phycisphaerae bacterium]